MNKKVLACLTALMTLVVMCGAPAVAFASGQTTKVETVYVITDSTGSQNDCIVSDHLVNQGKAKEIKDETPLKDINNVKGNEKYTKGTGNEISWEAGGNDIFYQGKTDKKPPVEMNVKYYLDGNEISGADLQNKSGHLKIRVKFENNSNYQGTKVPFIALTGMLITDDYMSNVTVNCGKVIDDGEKIIVAGLAAPGLRDSLDADLSDLNISDVIEIEGEANNFAVEDMMTVVSNAFFDEVDTDKIDDLDYDDEISQLSDGAKALVEGSKDLYDGIDYLNSKTDTLVDGVSQLSDGSKKLEKGTAKIGNSIVSKLDEMRENVGTMYEYSSSIYGGLVTLRDGIATAKAVLDQVLAGTGECETLLTNAGEKIKDAGNDMLSAGGKIVAAGGDLTSAGTSVGTAKAKVTAQENANATAKQDALDAINDLLEDESLPEEYKDAISGIKNKINGIDTSDQVTADAGAALASISAAGKKLNEEGKTDTAAGYLAQAGARLSKEGEKNTAEYYLTETGEALKEAGKGITLMSSGLGDALDNIGSYTKQGDKPVPNPGNTLLYASYGVTGGLYQLEDALSTSIAPGSEMNQGFSDLHSGAARLANGLSQLDDKSGVLADGVGQLDAGSLKLANGMAKLYKEGIKKIVDLYNDDLKGMVDELSGMLDAGKSYKCFTTLPEGMDGNVKFIYKTEINK